MAARMEISRERRRGAREQQVRHVRAADEKKEPDRREEKQQDRPKFADRVFVQRRDANAGVLVVVRILVLETPADRVHFAARLLERDARFQAGKDIEVIAAADRSRIDIRPDRIRRNAEGGWNPKLAVTVRLVIRRHHADDGVRLIVQQNFAADDVAIGAVTARPQFRAENDDVVVARLFVGRKQRAAENRRHAEKREQTGSRHRAADALRPVAIAQAALFAARSGHVGKDIVLRRPIDVVRRRGSAARLARAAHASSDAAP